MNTTTILSQAENLASDEEKLMLLGNFLGENMSSLEPVDLIRLLTPLVDITRRIYEQNPVQETIADYVIALIKLADNYIRDERGWLAMPLLARAEELLDDQPDTEENAQWKCHSYFDIGECYTMNTRRLLSQVTESASAPAN